MKFFLQRYALYLAWVIALVASAVSFMSGKFYQLAICEFCWYQRICLYPLALILGIAAFYKDTTVVRYALPLSFLGLFVALFHYLQQMFPNWFTFSVCSAQSACKEIDFLYGGFITWSFLNVLTNLFIILLLFQTSRRH